MAGLPSINLRALLVGVMSTTEGSATVDVPVPIGSQAQADSNFGVGSELSRMFTRFYSNNFANEVWGLGVSPGGTASAATGTITVTAAPTAPGTLWLYVAGQLVSGINIFTTDTVPDIATSIADAINGAYASGDPALPVSAVAAAGVVTLTALFDGVNGNEITVSLNYQGALGGQITPPGLGITLPTGGLLSGGVGTPDFTNAIANIQKEAFEYVAMPYADANSLFAWDQEFGFTDTGRWGWQRQQFGHVFSAKRGIYSDLILFGDTLNSGVESIMAMEQTCPSPMFEVAAAYTAKAQRALINDPARPLQTLSLNEVKAAPLQDRFNFVEINSLASNGLAIQEVGSDGQPMIMREQTTYQLNLYGQTDDAYELVTTLATLAKLLRNQRQAITSKFPRSKLADDGTKFGPGQAIVTPGIIKAELVNEYQLDMWNGLVENLKEFKANLMVERDPNDPNRVNVLYPPDLINQLRIFAVLAQFRLQYDRGLDTAIIGAAPPPFQAAGGTPQ
ncbi:MAG TPA: phage tail sheath C-terminal domain-containing protein [Xanthobacteraceae bacterium]|jgi:phage tail sheath gpL-like